MINTYWLNDAESSPPPYLYPDIAQPVANRFSDFVPPFFQSQFIQNPLPLQQRNVNVVSSNPYVLNDEQSSPYLLPDFTIKPLTSTQSNIVTPIFHSEPLQQHHLPLQRRNVNVIPPRLSEPMNVASSTNNEKERLQRQYTKNESVECIKRRDYCANRQNEVLTPSLQRASQNITTQRASQNIIVQRGSQNITNVASNTLMQTNRTSSDIMQEQGGVDRGRKRKRGRKPIDTSQFFCFHCSTRVTPQWRRGPNGPNSLCNACGLQYAKVLKLEEQRKRGKRKPLENNLDKILNTPISNDNSKKN